METEASLPNLLCKEGESSLNVSRGDQDDVLELCSVSESDCEFIEASLLHRESDFAPRDGDVPARTDASLLNRARPDVVKWILETRAMFGYQYRSAYLSAIYFDRFLTRRRFNDVKLWQIQLLSIACLSLAAKMEEYEARALTEYHVAEYNFEGFTAQRMELLVLNALEWKLSCLTPFAYLDYFAVKLCSESIRREHVNRASELVLAIMEEINVAEHKPSVIAAAAVLASYDCRLTKATLENKVEAIPSWGSQEKKDMLSCYTIYQEITSSKTPKSVITQNSPSPISNDGLQIMSKDNAKRRLNFDDSGRCCIARKIDKL